MICRNNKLFIIAITTVFTLISASSSWAQGHEGHNHGPGDHTLVEVPIEELNRATQLPEISIGQANARITIIEYASMTCGHCGRFHRDLFPSVKAKYIDTGIARLVVREFPLEKLALAVAMLARCVAADKSYDFIATLFARQQLWLQRGDIRPRLVAISREFGMTERKFDKCLKNESLVKKIMADRRSAIEKLGVKSTPTFFINGRPLVGPQSIEEFDLIIQPMLKR